MFMLSDCHADDDVRYDIQDDDNEKEYEDL